MSELKLNYPIRGYAKGNYICKCNNCKTEFMCDKRATECESCAINLMNEDYRKIKGELAILKSANRMIIDGFRTLEKHI